MRIFYSTASDTVIIVFLNDVVHEKRLLSILNTRKAIFIWVGFLELILVFCNNFYYSKYGNCSLVSHEKFAELVIKVI